MTTIESESVQLKIEDDRDVELENDYVFVFAGGVPPFPLLKSMGVEFGGQVTASALTPTQTADLGRQTSDRAESR